MTPSHVMAEMFLRRWHCARWVARMTGDVVGKPISNGLIVLARNASSVFIAGQRLPGTYEAEVAALDRGKS